MRGFALRLAGPMQAWGGPYTGDDHPSFDVPTFSGVLGLIAGALGITRAEPQAIRALADALALVVRVDAEGSRGVDFHTSEDVPRSDGKLRDAPVVSRRSYLYDASFAALLVVVGELPVTLERLVAALRRPRFVPYLGRKACPPAVPILALNSALEAESWPSMLAQVPLDRRRGRRSSPDIHVDARLNPSVSAESRALRLRDLPSGRAARLFDERVVYPMAFDARLHAPNEAEASKDTVTPWFR